MSLGPVKVTKTWPVRTGGKTDNAFYLIEDDSGKTSLTIWGAAAHNGAKIGDLITITGQNPNGGLAKNEYDGKIGIVANSCKVTIISDGQQENGQQQSHQSSGKVQLSKDDMIALHAQIKNDMKTILIGYGWSNEGAERAAESAPRDMALWWFGEKTVN